MRQFTITSIYIDSGVIAYYSILANDTDDDLIVEIPSGSKVAFSHDNIQVEIPDTTD